MTRLSTEELAAVEKRHSPIGDVADLVAEVRASWADVAEHEKSIEWLIQCQDALYRKRIESGDRARRALRDLTARMDFHGIHQEWNELAAARAVLSENPE